MLINVISILRMTFFNHVDMRKLMIRILVLLAFSCLTAKSQNINNPFAQIKERPSINVGAKKVRCYELNFGKEIKKCAFSADSTFMYLYLSNAEKVYCYDFKNNKIIWESSAKEPLVLDNIGPTMLLSRENFSNTDRKIEFINADNGKLLGDTKDPFNVYFDDQNKVGVKVGNHWNP